MLKRKKEAGELHLGMDPRCSPALSFACCTVSLLQAFRNHFSAESYVPFQLPDPVKPLQLFSYKMIVRIK